jgi:hypothetical protein
LVKHFAVLTGYAHFGFESLVSRKGENERSHFDGFGAGAENAEGFHWANTRGIGRRKPKWPTLETNNSM